MKPPTNAFRQALKATTSGACTVLLSTGLSCVFAVAIESSAHRLQYKLFPHWYDGKVKYALGLPHLQYAYQQQQQHQQQQTLENSKDEYPLQQQQVREQDHPEREYELEIYQQLQPLHHYNWQQQQQQKEQETSTHESFSTTSTLSKDVPLWNNDDNILLDSDSTLTAPSSKFQSFSDKMQEKVQLISPERVSKILLTTAMTG